MGHWCGSWRQEPVLGYALGMLPCTWTLDLRLPQRFYCTESELTEPLCHSVVPVVHCSPSGIIMWAHL